MADAARAGAVEAPAADTAGAEDDSMVGTRQPFELGDELAARIEALDLAGTLASLRDEGYGYVAEVCDADFTARLRETVLRLGRKGDSGPGGGFMLLDKDPIFVDVVTNPKLLAVAEVMCGQGALLSQVAASIKPKGGDGLALHADRNWTPAPFPVHNQLVTFCWVMDPYDRAHGSTKVVPKSHLKRRHPTPDEVSEERGAIATECDPGSAVVWGGSIWHGGYPRTADGERVVLHVTYGRLALRPVECYDYLDDAWLEDKPPEMRRLLGREDFLGTREGAYAGGTERIMKTFAWARS